MRELENIRSFLTGSALTLVVDLVFAIIFITVMFMYSTTLTLVVIASFPFYIAISAGVTPLFQKRLEDKFNKGAENQALLVESVTGVETLKAMAVGATDAAALGGTARRLCERQLRRSESRKSGESKRAARQQSW